MSPIPLMASTNPLHVLFFSFFFLLLSLPLSNSYSSNQVDCKDLESQRPNCSYLHSQNPCASQGYIDYLYLFYCLCGENPFVGYSLLALWLLTLFYLLGNTASIYFCSSLESLSKLLSLPPTIAGVTLLSLGNGAPDVFASIVSFASNGVGEVGLSSVLGGALFVSSVVVGVICISVSSLSVTIDRNSFVRDISFFVAVLCFLLVILIVGEIGVLGASLFVCFYFVYVGTVSVSCYWRRNQDGLGMPLLESVEIEEPTYTPKEVEEEEEEGREKCKYLIGFLHLVELPLSLPRRLTIPEVSEERWSKPFAVSSAILSPILLATLWNSKRKVFNSEEILTVYLISGLIGLVLGMVVFETTECSKPPKKCLFPWVAGGFLMSVVWTYIIAGELVSLLVSIGYILEISPSVLAVTVLAWGNSIGDLIANAAMALNGGEDGAHIAISGCYAGPIFNTLVGLGLSLVLASWNTYPHPYEIPKDASILVTLGFLMGGLLWALVMIPKRGMKLDRVVGVGLIGIYSCFLCLRVCESIGLVLFEGFFR